MWLKRVLALALLGPLLGPFAAGYSALVAPGGHCTTGLCVCAHEARPVPEEEPMSCHRARPPRSVCRIQARCTHEMPVLPGTRTAVVTAALEGPAPDASNAVPAPLTFRGPLRGFSRIDPLPPRPA
jgi:hypothetical protein